MIGYCTEQLVFLKTIADNPKEDTPRLMYADWLDENPDIDPGRAELIRVQCELLCRSSCPDRHEYCCGMNPDEWCVRCQYGLLQVRERALLTGERWRTGPKCGECEGHWKKRGEGCCLHCEQGDGGGLRREFDYAAIRTHMSDRDTVQPVRLLYDRGFIARVEVPRLSDCVERIPSGASDRYRPTPWLRAVLTATPERGLIREVVPLNVCNDYYLDGDIDGTTYWRSSSIFDHECIPKEVCPEESYITREGAFSGLGQHIVQFTRIYHEKVLARK